jgi:hypothetical protein
VQTDRPKSIIVTQEFTKIFHWHQCINNNKFELSAHIWRYVSSHLCCLLLISNSSELPPLYLPLSPDLSIISSWCWLWPFSEHRHCVSWVNCDWLIYWYTDIIMSSYLWCKVICRSVCLDSPSKLAAMLWLNHVFEMWVIEEMLKMKSFQNSTKQQ